MLEGQNLQNDEAEVLEDNYSDDDTSTESEGETSSESEESDTVTLTRAELDEQLKQARREQDKRWKEERIPQLLKGEDGGEKGSKESGKKSDQEVDSSLMERLDRSDLRSEGYRDTKEQDIILEYARWKGITPLEAANTAAVKAELKEYRAKAATPGPSKRTGTGTRDEVAYWADQMEKGKRAPTAEMRQKALAYLAKNKR